MSAMKKRDAPSRKSVSFERPMLFIDSYEKLPSNEVVVQEDEESDLEQVPQTSHGGAKGFQVRKRNTDREMHDR